MNNTDKQKDLKKVYEDGFEDGMKHIKKLYALDDPRIEKEVKRIGFVDGMRNFTDHIKTIND